MPNKVIEVDVADVIYMAFIHAKDDRFTDSIADLDLVDELAMRFTELHHDTNWEEHESDWESEMYAFYTDKMTKKDNGDRNWFK